MTEPTPLLVLVHPGSLCGSLTYNRGRYDAYAIREDVIAELDNWRGQLLVRRLRGDCRA